MKPDAVIVTTANNLHLPILRACAQRHIHFFTEKPMAASGADAREMARVASEAGIKLMVNYPNIWSPATQEAAARLKAGELGPIQKIIVEFGHQGPKEDRHLERIHRLALRSQEERRRRPDGLRLLRRRTGRCG